jgi:BirA family biotin operon repressor/biotin-[acetyl-CoA-carboxylase] ligase
VSFHLSELRRAIKPFRLHFFPRLRSTSDHAITLRKRGALYAPAIVLTPNQMAGRGRGSNNWWSDRGCLTATFVFAVDEQLQAHQIPLLAGLAVRNAAAELTGDDQFKLKWPNDVLYEGRKVAGLLCERAQKLDLIGVGMNVSANLARVPKSIKGRVGSLHEVARGPLDMSTALATVARHLHAALSRRQRHSFAQVLAEYDQHHALIGRNVMVIVNGDEGPIAGRCEGLDNLGRLLVRDRRTLHHVIAGQVRMD